MHFVNGQVSYSNMANMTQCEMIFIIHFMYRVSLPENWPAWDLERFMGYTCIYLAPGIIWPQQT